MAVYHNAVYHKDNVRKNNPTKSVLEGLRALQKEMNTQDPMCQAAPRFWQIMGEQTIPADGEEIDGYIIYDNEAACTVADDIVSAFQEIADLVDELEESTGAWFEEGAEGSGVLTLPGETLHVENMEDACEALNHLDHIINRTIRRRYELIPFRTTEKEYQDTLFLTKRAADDHLRRYGYNYDRKAHACAHTAVRSPEVDLVWEFLQTTDFTLMEALYDQYLYGIPVPERPLNERIADLLSEWLALNSGLSDGLSHEDYETVNSLRAFFADTARHT